MTRTLRIDFVSDVVCPWCAIGLYGLEVALERLGGDVAADVTFHAFELNPAMAPGGENLLEHITEKYGISPEQARANSATIRARAADLGFAINTSDASRIYNTFGAHRLLAWAKTQGRQAALKRALFAAYFTAQADLDDPDTLVAAAETAGLGGGAAREVLASDRFAAEVRREVALWSGRGVTAVPAVVVDGRHAIVGGQPPEAFEQQLRAILAAAPAA